MSMQSLHPYSAGASYIYVNDMDSAAEEGPLSMWNGSAGRYYYDQNVFIPTQIVSPSLVQARRIATNLSALSLPALSDGQLSPIPSPTMFTGGLESENYRKLSSSSSTTNFGSVRGKTPDIQMYESIEIQIDESTNRRYALKKQIMKVKQTLREVSAKLGVKRKVPPPPNPRSSVIYS